VLKSTAAMAELEKQQWRVTVCECVWSEVECVSEVEYLDIIGVK
jgi:hypothetical protein